MPADSYVAFFIPDRPVRVLVLAHGFPWLDGAQSDDFLAAAGALRAAADDSDADVRAYARQAALP
jgi:hypothetical protein